MIMIVVLMMHSGLSGCTREEIARVSPEFIKEAGISQSLTPGRNNGFLNMLNSMKQKAHQLVEEAEATAAAKESNHDDDDCKDAEQEQQQQQQEDETSFEGRGGPIYNSIMASLQQLQPTFVKLVDTSHQHAGHAGVKGTKNGGGESHFEVTIVANAFEGLNLVKRHQLVYMILGKEMPQIHALNIKANTPNEAASGT
jgi:BolA protein/25S rRNA (uracil2634-N3)-methyltransferase